MIAIVIECDIVVFRIDDNRFDFDTLSAINPRLVYCSLSGFGQAGPYRDKAAHDLNYLAIAGVLNQLGDADRPPPIPLNIIADYAGATMHGVVGILLALFARQTSGRGQHVDVAYLDSAFALLCAVPGIRNYLVGASEPQRGHNLFSSGYAYYTLYQTADDRWLSVACMEPWLWDNFCDALGRTDLKAHRMQTDDFEQPASEQARNAKAQVAEIIQAKPLTDWIEFFADKDVCVGPVNHLSETLADPHLRERDMVLPLAGGEQPGLQPGIPIKLSHTPGAIRTPRPSQGEHTEELLIALGRSTEEISDLRKRGVI